MPENRSLQCVRPTQKRKRLEGKKRAENVLKERCCYYAAHGRFLWIDHGPGAKDALGELQCKGKPEF